MYQVAAFYSGLELIELILAAPCYYELKQQEG